MTRLLGTAFAAAFASAPLLTQPLAPARVGPTVQVSRSGAEREHEEVYLGAHPTDPNRLLACSIVDRTRYYTAAIEVGSAPSGEKGGPR